MQKVSVDLNNTSWIVDSALVFFFVLQRKLSLRVTSAKFMLILTA